MSAELRDRRDAANKLIAELNAFLADADADVPPVAAIETWDDDALEPTRDAGALLQQHIQRVDMLTIPEYVDARAHTTLHRLLDALQQLDEAREVRVMELRADA